MTAAASITDAVIHKKMFGSVNKILIISNEERNVVMKIVISQTIKNEVREQKEGLLGILLGTLSASILGNLLTSKGTTRAAEGTIEAGQYF